MTTLETVLLAVLILLTLAHAYSEWQWRLAFKRSGENWSDFAKSIIDAEQAGFAKAQARLGELATNALDAEYMKRWREAKKQDGAPAAREEPGT